MAETQLEQLQAAVHTRTYSWSDPIEVLPTVAGLSGRELLQAMVDGTVPYPPIGATLGFGTFEVGEDFVAVTARAQDFHYNPIGVVHGGVIATLLDTAAGCAVHATLAAGEAYTSLDLSTKFVRPMTLDSGVVRAEGRVLHRGSRTAVATATLVDSRGRLLAHATSTLMLFGGASR
jgi:uncharacterized protein (TIGR00369 family)